MPMTYPRDGDGLPFLTTRTLQAREENPTESIALHGGKALTPIIAGTISGVCVGVAWLVALIVILVKRYRRRRYYKKMGKPTHESQPRPPGEEYILPPDPAVLEGKHQPGDRVVVLRKKRWWRRLPRTEKKKVVAATASEAHSAKGKERVSMEKMPQEVYNSEIGEVQDKMHPDNVNARAENQQTASSRHSNENPHHPYFNRLDTILSLPEAPEDHETQRLQDTSDDGALKKTDFAVGGVDEELTTSGSYPEQRHEKLSSYS